MEIVIDIPEQYLTAMMGLTGAAREFNRRAGLRLINEQVKSKSPCFKSRSELMEMRKATLPIELE